MRGEISLFNYLCNIFSIVQVILALIFSTKTYTQTPLFSDVPVSDNGTNNSIGSANTSRNVSADLNGNIYVVYANNSEVRLAKSTDGGQSFLASILVANTSTITEPEIAINNTGNVYVAWVENETINFTRSTDGGNTFSTIETFGTITPSPKPNPNIHMAVFENNVYITDEDGKNVYYNNNNGVGGFNITNTGIDMVYADVLTDQNGTLFVPMDDPNLVLFNSTNQGGTLNQIVLAPPGQVFFSSYALSDGPCGTFIFVGGGGSASQSETLGYRINAITGETTEINLGANTDNFETRTLFADNEGTFIDGYRISNGDLMINISSDQGNSFATPIVVANGDSHNIAKSPTTNNILVTYQRNGRIFLTVYDNILKSVEIPEPSPPLVFCSNQSFDLPFTLSGIFSSGSIFSVFLSDENGDFSNSTEIGTITTDVSGVINCTIPSGLIPSNDYRIQIESVANCIQSNSIPISIGEGSISGNSEACEGDTIQLTNTGTPNSSSPWSSSNTSVAIINNNGLVTTLTPGTTNITFTTDNGCVVSHPIEVFEVPSINQNITLNGCDDNFDGTAAFNTSTIETTLLNGQTGMTISYVDANGTALPSPLPNPFNSENQTITARVENSQRSECFTEIDIEFIVNITPTANQISPLELCDDDFDGIVAFDTSAIESSILNGQTGVTVSYFNASGTSLPSPLPNPFNSGNQTITVRLENTQATICFAGTTVDFIVREKPIVDLNEEDSICMNDNPSLDISVQNPDSSYTYTWTNESGAQIGSGETINVSNGGIYKVTATSQFMCTSEEETIKIVEFFPPNISENDVTSSTSNNSNSISINTTEVPPDEFEYGLLDVHGNFVYNFQSSSVFNNLSFGLYTVVVRSLYNCGEDKVEVSLINFPDFFTPNGDTKNETWTVEGFNNSFYPSSNIFIYDRYGKIMAELPAENPSWDGTYNGIKVPSTDYWYRVKLVDIYGRVREERGHFSLLRR